jgi:soluble lytic murein transglycosylase-like protein
MLLLPEKLLITGLINKIKIHIKVNKSSLSAKDLIMGLINGETLHSNIDNPLMNIIAGAKYMHYCLKRFDNDPVPALACYNAGPASIKTIYVKNREKFIVPPYRQTEIYIIRVYKYYLYYRRLLKR